MSFRAIGKLTLCSGLQHRIVLMTGWNWKEICLVQVMGQVVQSHSNQDI
jgi:hypothetical protein